MNDRDEHIAGDDDSEYHFSDDDVSYEVEPETEKPIASTIAQPETPLKRLTGSKRMLIALAIFFVLMFIVYRMLSRTPAPAIDITPVANTTTPATSNNPAQPNVPVSQVASTVNAGPVNTPSNLAAAPATNNNPAPQTIAQASAPAPQATPPALPPPHAAPAPTPPLALPQAMPGQTVPTQAIMQPVAGMPTVIPVAPSTYAPANQANDLNQQASALLYQQNEKLMAQMQAEYQQHLNNYAQQNRAMQEQMQILATRVATMETQLNQIYQAVSQSKQQAKPAAKTPVVPAKPNGKVPYTVQAIIPGRAWLKSDTGDTVTVTEGDMLKEVGRVTRIDPYDGVVEVNTGATVVSLSYGAGG